jgi:2,4-dichlorophenol 6-monooxygenase
METTQVVIIGGGGEFLVFQISIVECKLNFSTGCGLTLSSLLSNYGVDHILFEQHATTSRLPKAHYINQRTMEIFRQHGLADEIVATGADGRFFRRIVWKSSLGGDKPTDRRTLASVNAFPAGHLANRDKPHGPMCSRNLPQIRLEPILKQLAIKKNPEGIRFEHRVVDIVSTDSGVVVKVVDAEGLEHTVQSKYVVGADGGRFVGANIGTQMHGIRNIFEVVTTHFKADLSKIWDEDVFLANVKGEHGEAGVLPMGPTWGKHSEEWVIHMSHPVGESTGKGEDQIKTKIAAILSIPTSDIEILMISAWSPECVLSDAYKKGPVFIAGDAAHRHPPTSGLGLNTAVADAHNLAWKLALVLKHGANGNILDSYEQERHPAGRRNCDWSLMALSNRRVLATALEMAAQTEQLCVNEGGLRSSKALLQAVLETQKVEFSAHDLEVGHIYESVSIVPDGTAIEKVDPLGQVYYPSTRPGHRLPHCWLRTSTSSSIPTVSTHDLVGQSLQFVLVTDAGGQAWKDAISDLQSRSPALVKCVTILPRGTQSTDKASEFIDVDGQWENLSELSQGGAILIRPDNYVAWRSINADAQAIPTLIELLKKTLKSSKSSTDLKL